MTVDRDPEGMRLPVRIDTTSNGEFAPVPLGQRDQIANDLAKTRVGENVRRLDMAWRGFLVFLYGAASTLFAVNRVNAAAGKSSSSTYKAIT